jgi:hypothetical protein
LETEVIKVASAGVADGETPAAWFSTNPVWEMTCNKLWQDGRSGQIFRLSKNKTMQVGKGLVRIEVHPEVAPYTWKDFLRMSGISRSTARGMLDIAKMVGANPWEWRASFEPIEMDYWLNVEGWNAETRRWESINSEQLDVESIENDISIAA